MTDFPRCKWSLATKSLVIPVVAVSAVLGAPVSGAQDAPSPGEVRQSIRQQRPELPAESQQAPVSAAPGAVTAVPEGGPKIHIDRFEITGNEIISTADLRALVAPYENRDLTLFEIYAVSDILTRHYHAQGYSVASCNVPEQQVASGVVTLEIIEGRIDEVRIEGNKRYRTGFLNRHIDAVEPGTVVTDSMLREQLDPLNQLPGMRAQAVIQPGTDFGESIVVFRTEEDPASAAFRINNYGRESIGDLRVEGNLTLNSWFGIGDRFEFDAVQAEKDLLDYYSVAYSMPVFDDPQTRVAVYYNTYDYEVSDQNIALGLSGDGENFGISFSHRIPLETGAVVTLGIGYDRTETTQVAGAFGATKRDLDLMQISGSYSVVHSRDALSMISGVVSTNFNAGDRDPATLLPENNSQAFKLRLDLGHYRNLVREWALLVRASFVVSPEPLVDTEQFRIGGRDSVRAYASAEIGGDYGYALSVEVQRPLEWLPRLPTRFSLFADVGTAFKIDNDVLHLSKSDTVAGFGAGLEFRVTDNSDLTLEIARRLGSRRALDGRDDVRVWAGMTVNF